MMKTLTAIAFAAALLLGTTGSGLAQGLFKTCKEDLATYCAAVVPGDGRTLACLYAHSATLSDDCFEATDGIGRVLEGFFDKLSDVNAMCADDLHTHCSDVQRGMGYTYQCLREHADQLSKGCASELPHITGGGSEG